MMGKNSPLTTLCYIERDNQFLMMHRIKKENDVNKDKWIGVGGHFEEGESPEECLKREVREETGLTLTSFQFRGIVTFCTESWQTEYMCLYTADGFCGELTQCGEGVLEWVDKKDILNLNLWEGDLVFFQLLEQRQTFFSLVLRYEKDVLAQCLLDGSPMELLDLLDEEGQPTGRRRERSLVHRYGDRHRTAHVWLVRPNLAGSFDLMLQKRSCGKDSFPGCYDISSAGHVPAGHDFLQSALRELAEELGIGALPEDLYDCGVHEGYAEAEFYGRPFLNREYSRVFLYTKPVEEGQLHLQESEVESVLWIDYETCVSQMEDGSLNHCIFPDEMKMVGAWARKLLRSDK